MSERAGIAFTDHTEGPRRPVKLVVAGPFASGKTTLITTISEGRVLATERTVTRQSSADKRETTVALDFGRITFENGSSIHLFGTPGQRRFEDVWGVVAEGMAGLVLLVNAADPSSSREAAAILDSLHRRGDVPLVIGVTHLDQVDESADRAVARTQAELGPLDDAAVVACDPRVKEDVKSLLLRVLMQLRARLER